MRRNYYLMSVFPVPREMAWTYIFTNMNGKRAFRVLERYTVFTKFSKDKKQRDFVLLSNEPHGHDFIIIANSTAITLLRWIQNRLDYFFSNEKTIMQALRPNKAGWKPIFVTNYFGKEPLNVVKLYHKGQLNLSKEDIKAVMNLYFDGEFDGIETFEVLPDDLTEYRLIEFYLIETHEEKSLKGVSTTRYFLLLVP